jgi:diguanylate cyclase (GGDEF)-like protein
VRRGRVDGRLLQHPARRTSAAGRAHEALDLQQRLRPYLWLLGGVAATLLSGLVVAVFDPLDGVLKGSVRWREVDEILVPGGVAFAFLLVSLVHELRRGRQRERHLAELYDELLRKEAELERLAITDALTGLYNRRFFQSRLAGEVGRARRYGRVLSLVMLDLDNFKEINDQHGHQFGDHVLAEVGKILTTNVRASDIVCRYGGEEFAVLLPETGPEQAGLTAEKLRTRLKEHFRAGDDALALTVSLGVASYPSPCVADENDLVKRADAALYEAKGLGRDRVEGAKES